MFGLVWYPNKKNNEDTRLVIAYSTPVNLLNSLQNGSSDVHFFIIPLILDCPNPHRIIVTSVVLLFKS